MMKIVRGSGSPVNLTAFMIFVACACVGGVFSRSVRSTDRHGNDTVGRCDAVRPFFEAKNVTVEYNPNVEASVKTTCGGPCCNWETEERVRHQARADFHNLIHHHSRSLQGLLATTADALRETVTALARQSENKTLTLFNQVYQSMALLSRPSIRALYQEMVHYVSPDNTPDTLQQPLTRDMLQERFVEFFTRLFPIAYHHAVYPRQQDFTDKFKQCLYETIDEIQPFGDIPRQVSRSVSKSLEATRVLVQALTLGKMVLDRTDSVLFSGASPQQEACYEALLRMTYCPKCRGIVESIRPCAGLCTNVMRGCLTEPASELDLAWSGYVETVERLVVAVDGRNDPLGLNAERAMRQLDTRISDAIMHAMENGPALEEKVRKVCGRSELRTTESEATGSTSADLESADDYPPPSHRTLPTQLHVQLGNFLASVVRSRTFYGTLADAICEEHPDKRCWNGERIGEYAKTVVDSSLTAQRYNPEFTVSATASTVTSSYGNSNTSELIDQLRHINQVVQSQLASAPDSGALLADEALDGSGSGSKPKWRDGAIDADPDGDEEDGEDDDEEASGSGMGPSSLDTVPETRHENKVTGGAAALTSYLLLILLGLSCVPLAA